MPNMKSIVKGLSTVPIELALEILNDLRVWDIMLLMIENSPAVNRALLAHHHCKALLGEDEGKLANSRERVRKWVDLATEARVSLHFGWGYWYTKALLYFSTDDLKFIYRSKLTHDLNYYIWVAIESRTTAVDLQPYALVPISSPTVNTPVEELRKHWQAFDLAKQNLARQSASQITWAADILEKNPDILKRTLDPEQVRRPNQAHILGRMRRTAAIFLRPWYHYKFRLVEFFSYAFFPVIPFDRALQTLCYRMEKHGITTGDKETPLSEGGAPSSIKSLAQCVIDGMPCYYTSSCNQEAAESLSLEDLGDGRISNGKGQVLRTGGTSWSEKPVRPTNHDIDSGAYFTPYKLGGNGAFLRKGHPARHDVFDRREEVWLESFVALYRHLEELENISGEH